MYVGPEVVFELCDARDAGSFTLSMGGSNAKISLDGCILYTGANGLTLSTGKVEIDHGVNIYTKNYGQLDSAVGKLTSTGMTKTVKTGAAVSVNGVDGWGS